MRLGRLEGEGIVVVVGVIGLVVVRGIGGISKSFVVFLAKEV